MSGGCEYLIEGNIFGNPARGAVVASARDENKKNLCSVFVSKFACEPVPPFCLQKTPSNNCPLASYQKGKIGLEEAVAQLGK